SSSSPAPESPAPPVFPIPPRPPGAEPVIPLGSLPATRIAPSGGANRVSFVRLPRVVELTILLVALHPESGQSGCVALRFLRNPHSGAPRPAYRTRKMACSIEPKLSPIEQFGNRVCKQALP